MPSAVETARRRTRAGAAAVLVLMALPTAAITTPAATPPPTREQIAAAVAKLKADPNLGVVKKTRKRVQNSRPESEQNAPGTSPDRFHWLTDAFKWLADAARALLWVAGILLAGVLALYIKRFVEMRGERSASLRLSMPTHVGDLDIRPESLPDDVGGAALELWERGEHRAALSLLYRGLLSRLAHVHGVPIRDSSTEGDCLALAATHLPATRVAYVDRLIRVWQRAVYGNTEPASDEFSSLSTGFSAAVDRPQEIAVLEHAA